MPCVPSGNVIHFPVTRRPSESPLQLGFLFPVLFFLPAEQFSFPCLIARLGRVNIPAKCEPAAPSPTTRNTAPVFGSFDWQGPSGGEAWLMMVLSVLLEGLGFVC